MQQRNEESKPRAIILSASSGIGEALAKSWSQKGWRVFGTYRTNSPSVSEMSRDFGVHLTPCDMSCLSSIEKACDQFKAVSWDVLVFATGTMEPIGPFEALSFNEWEESIQVNFLRQMRILHRLLPYRNKISLLPEPCVLFFAAGGANNAVVNYSSYTLSKIALTKACEFLDAEMPDVRFAIVGPGWVKTKIHEETLRAGVKAGSNFSKTEERLKGTEWVPMEKVVACCTWIATTPSRTVRGRNFSVVNDLFGHTELEKALEKDPHMYKLRRFQNGWLP